MRTRPKNASDRILQYLAGAFLFLTFGLSSGAIADVQKLVSDPKLLRQPDSLQHYRVATARVILADYPMIRRDFPELQGLDDSQIDAWLLEKAGYVTKQQTRQEEVNTTISIQRDAAGNRESRDGLRPEMYNRATVFETGAGRPMLDVKGTGTKAPRMGSHGDGLATLGEAIREFLYQKMVQKIFDHSGSRLKTVGNYAVIDWGFDVIHSDRSRSPAGAIVRQAHERPEVGLKGNHFLDSETSLFVERVLRTYGMASSGEAGPELWDPVNIQGTVHGEVVDFGSFLVRKSFTKKTYRYMDWCSFLDARNALERTYFLKRAKPLLEPGKPGWVDPDPQLRLDFEMWGFSVTGTDDPKFDNPWVWSHELARDLRSGKASRVDAWTHYQNLVLKKNFDPAIGGRFSTEGQQNCIAREISSFLPH